MDKQVSARIIAVISLPMASQAQLLVKSLRPFMQTEFPCIHLNIATKVFPSSWGGISGNPDLLKPKSTETATDANQLSLDDLKELRQWVETGRIVLLPAGFSGSLHAVLNTDELKHELEWSIANPWRSGIKDNFGSFNDTIVPFWPDPFHPRLISETASRYDAMSLGILPDDAAGNGQYLVFATRDSANSFQVMPWLSLSNGENSRQKCQKIEQTAQQHPQGSLFVRFEPSENCDNLSIFIDAVRACAEHGLEFASHIQPGLLEEYNIAHRLPEIVRGQLAPLFQPSLSMNPDFRWQLSKLPEGRRARTATQERIRTQLLCTAPGIQAQTITVQAEPPIRNRNLLAMMQGSATIMADDFEARFLEGKFTGFYRQNPDGSDLDSIPIGSAIGSALLCGDRSMVMETESAVSFETDYTRGLRETLVLRNEMTRIPGRMTSDFLVADRSRHIILDMQIRYPWFSKTIEITEVRPVSFCVAVEESARAAGINIDWKRHDGSDGKTTLQPKPDDKPAKTSPRIFEHHIFQGARKLVAKLQKFSNKQEPVDGTAWINLPSLILYGSSWTISWEADGHTKGLQISRLPDERHQSVPLEIRLRQDASTKKLFVDIFPEGRYFNVSSDDLRSLNHHFVLGIYPFFGKPGELPAMDEMVNKEVPPFFMVRES